MPGGTHFAIGLSAPTYHDGRAISGCRPLGDGRDDYMEVSGICLAGDAALMSAAPDLLEALKAAESLFHGTFAQGGTVHKQMQAAIAKAEQGQ